MKHWLTPEGRYSSVCYVFIVEGKEAAAKRKIVCEESREAAATAIMHELQNNLSVVFTCAILKPDIDFMRQNPGKYHLEHAGTMEEMEAPPTEKAEKQGKRKVRVLC